MANDRVTTVVRDLMARMRDVLVEHQVTYPEYQAAKQFIIGIGEAGEWPLFLDVFCEATVEQNTYGAHSTQTAIEGPYYVPDAPEMASPANLNTDPQETGDPLNFSGTVQTADGSAAAGAVVDVWHADADGRYSNIHPQVAEWKFRARVTTDADGAFSIDTIVPPPYEIPKDGPTGALLRAAGWHAFRPAHLHVRVTAPGHEPLTTQLYFEGDPYLDSDVADAVKPDVVVRLDKREGGDRVSYATSYDFKLFPPVDAAAT